MRVLIAIKIRNYKDFREIILEFMEKSGVLCGVFLRWLLDFD